MPERDWPRIPESYPLEIPASCEVIQNLTNNFPKVVQLSFASCAVSRVSAPIRQIMADKFGAIGQSGPDVGQSWPQLAKCWAQIGQELSSKYPNRPELAGLGPIEQLLSNCWASVGQPRTSSGSPGGKLPGRAVSNVPATFGWILYAYTGLHNAAGITDLEEREGDAEGAAHDEGQGRIPSPGAPIQEAGDLARPHHGAHGEPQGQDHEDCRKTATRGAVKRRASRGWTASFDATLDHRLLSLF